MDLGDVNQSVRAVSNFACPIHLFQQAFTPPGFPLFGAASPTILVSFLFRGKLYKILVAKVRWRPPLL